MAQVPAQAYDCGDGRADLDTGPYCILAFFDTTTTVTIPADAVNPQAIIVGGGGGAYIDASGFPYTTYSGNAGKVRYVDLSSVPAGTVLNLVAGSAGYGLNFRGLGAATSGGDSSISYGTTTWTAPGGLLPTSSDSTCTLTINYLGITTTVDPSYTRQGSSALADSAVDAGACGALALGPDPATDADSYGNPALSWFADPNRPANYGNRLASAGAIDATVPPMSTFLGVQAGTVGDGGHVAVELRDLHLTGGIDGKGIPQEVGAGGTGAVYLRWGLNSGSGGGSGSGGNSGGSGGSLAGTGSDSVLLATAAGIAMASGFAMTRVMSRRRRK